jgi:membrane-bound lytic murein transglycosylase C
MLFLKTLFIFTITFKVLTAQQTFEEFKLQQEKDFSDFKNTIDEEYQFFKKSEDKAYKIFKKNIEREWNHFKESSPDIYVSYDNDFLSRSIIDFDNGEMTIEVIIKEEEIKTGHHDGSFDSLFGNISRFGLSYIGKSIPILNFYFKPFVPQTADHVYMEFERMGGEPLLQNLGQTKLFKKLIKILSEKDGNGDRLLENQIKDDKGSPLNLETSMKTFAKNIIQKKSKQDKSYIGKNGGKRRSFSLKFDLHKNHKNVRSNKYGKQIVKQSKRFNIDPAIAMAVTETESSFNPKATSHIPAYGLMQLVPSSGGRDAYNYVYNKDKFLGKRYLYKPDNNIELGCAYLSKIRYKYFKGILDEEKAMLCTIAAYNTGAGNVCKAISNTTRFAPTIKKVNQMSSKKLYKTLLKNLEYDETKNYLEKVWDRKDKYKS